MKPIFIIGIAGRSGTHYLKQLLNKHPDIGKSILKREDHFISELNYLDLYVKNISYYWKRNDKKHEDEIKKRLKVGLGRGIIDFANIQINKKYFLLNTPYTHNIDLFQHYFPDQKMIIITRNAKDLVESGVRSKFWNYEEGLELWNRSAKRIIEFQARNKDNFFIVKYEDLYTDTVGKLKEIFDYLNIDSENYQFNKLEKTPIQGSSDAKGEKESWEYKTLENGKNFNPLKRSENWNFFRKWRFNWKCGANSLLLNYEVGKIKLQALYYLVNLFLDVVLLMFKIKIILKNKMLKFRAK